MFDLDITWEQMLADVGARVRDGPAPLLDPLDPRFLSPTEHRLLVRGRDRDDLFPLLKVLLSARFAHVPPSERTRDLLDPLRAALGGARVRGDEDDRSRTIEVEIAAASRGAALAVRDEGHGFDAARAEQLRNGEGGGESWGAGMRTLERARSRVAYANGGRTLLLLFLCAPEGTSKRARRSRPGEDPFLRDVARGSARMRAALGEELRELRGPGMRLMTCRVYRDSLWGEDAWPVRVVLRWSEDSGRPTETTVLAGRLLPEAMAVADFEAGRKLHTFVRPKRVHLPAPVKRSAVEPRLVLYAFDPWMNLRDYAARPGSPDALERVAGRVGACLRTLHESAVPLPVESWCEFLDRRRARGREIVTRLLELDRARGERAERAFIGRLERGTMTEPTPRVPIHGAIGWESIHYGADGRFYLNRFEKARVSHPGVDVGGFLADLLQLSAGTAHPALPPPAREFLAAYHGGDAPAAWERQLPMFVADAHLQRVGRLLRGRGRGHGPAIDALLSQCERTLAALPAGAGNDLT